VNDVDAGVGGTAVEGHAVHLTRLKEQSLMTRLAAVLAVMLTAVLTTSPDLAVASPKKTPHCVAPTGDDLNEIWGTRDAFVAPFCTEVRAGAWWRPVLRWLVADTWESTPAGFTPSGETPIEDFLMKFEGSRYVIDAGTRQEREYEFSAEEVMLLVADNPGGPDFARWAPRLHPLRPGVHTVEKYDIYSDMHCDGFSAEDGGICVHAGENLAESLEFVVSGGRGSAGG
jgi:hypothetical protein